MSPAELDTGSPEPLGLASNVPLAAYTTIKLGGRADEFVTVSTEDQLREVLSWGTRNRRRTQIIGGGSNIIFADEGFRGLVVRIGMKGIVFKVDGDDVTVTAGAGEEWDQFVRMCIDRGWQGIECLSGIPGNIGGTPIQNVGAYGQEVSQSIAEVRALDRITLRPVVFTNRECEFSYRESRFKNKDFNRYVLTSVIFQLKAGRPSAPRYPDIQKELAGVDLEQLDAGAALRAVREAVLKVRKRKSMVVDPSDENSRSCGSFFVNPVFTMREFRALEERFRMSGVVETIPRFASDSGMKVPAAWLVENAGYPRAYRRGGVGVSANHSLALVNFGGTTRELLFLAREIEESVEQRFGVRLEREPVVVEP